MYSKFKVGVSEMCPYNADIMTAEHLLQHCQLHDALKRDVWPEPIPLRVKLYGNLEEQRRTVAFVRATGISRLVYEEGEDCQDLNCGLPAVIHSGSFDPVTFELFGRDSQR